MFGRMGDYVWRRIGLNGGIFASELELQLVWGYGSVGGWGANPLVGCSGCHCSGDELPGEP